MPDYVEIEDAGGVKRKISVDEIAEQFVQRVKMQWGADNAGTDVSEAAPLPIKIMSYAAALPAGNNNIGDVDVATLPTLPAGTNNIGDVDVLTLPALVAGTAAIGKLAANSGVDIGDVDVTSITAGSNKIGDVGLGTRTSGGLTINKNLDVDETEDAIKATAGQLYGYYYANLATTWRYLKLYNETVASVVVGTAVPVITLPLPPESAGHVSLPVPIAFSTAITVAATTALADNNAGAPGTNEVVFNAYYA